MSTLVPKEQQLQNTENPVKEVANVETPVETTDAPHLPQKMVKDLVQVFKLLSDETRLRILLFLFKKEEFHVRALCELLGQSQPAVSHHLALLRVAGLIEPRREGKHNFYRVVPDRFEQLLLMVFNSSAVESNVIKFAGYQLSQETKTEEAN